MLPPLWGSSCCCQGPETSCTKQLKPTRRRPLNEICTQVPHGCPLLLWSLNSEQGVPLDYFFSVQKQLNDKVRLIQASPRAAGHGSCEGSSSGGQSAASPVLTLPWELEGPELPSLCFAETIPGLWLSIFPFEMCLQSPWISLVTLGNGSSTVIFRGTLKAGFCAIFKPLSNNTTARQPCNNSSNYRN